MINKKELIANIVGNTGSQVTKKETTEWLDLILDAIKDAMLDDGVDIRGFGKFGCKEVAERKGTIQFGEKKGEQYCVPAHKAPTCKFATAVKEMFN